MTLEVLPAHPQRSLDPLVEVGALNPIYRDHTAKGTADQGTVGAWPGTRGDRRKFIELRYELMPYLYTGIEEAVAHGASLDAARVLEYPQASVFYGDDRDFLFGSDFFVAPVTTEMADAEEISCRLATGTDFWTNTRLSSKESLACARGSTRCAYVRCRSYCAMQHGARPVKNRWAARVACLSSRQHARHDCRGTLYSR